MKYQRMLLISLFMVGIASNSSAQDNSEVFPGADENTPSLFSLY